jgi:hypothetical protein
MRVQRGKRGSQLLELGVGVAAAGLAEIDRAAHERVGYPSWDEVHVQVRKGVAVAFVVLLHRVQ